MAQAETIRGLLQGMPEPHSVELVTIRTSGDRGHREQLGAFVKEIQQALLGGEIDIAQHCLKDLPVCDVPGLELACFLPREDARDALVSAYGSIEALPPGSIVGTGSVRRTAQLALVRPDLSFRPLVGNVDTRLRKLLEGQYDAIVLAIAGLMRLNLLASWAEGEFASLYVHPLEPEVMLPAPGQAILVLECRSDNLRVKEFLLQLDDADTRASGTAERSFLGAFGGGCSVPVAALAVIERDELCLTGRVCSPDGLKRIEGRKRGSDASSLGTSLATELGERGAFDLFKDIPRGGMT